MNSHVPDFNSEGPKPVATPRPDRLVNRLKSITLDDASAPRLVIVRQPRGPDNSKVRLDLQCWQLSPTAKRWVYQIRYLQ